MLWGERFLSLGVFASGLAGGLLGFLIYNFHPAKVFMGDTGSLFLGGAVAALAFAYDMPLILVTLGIMYIIEALSDIIQVGYFKLTHGKRVFKNVPVPPPSRDGRLDGPQVEGNADHGAVCRRDGAVCSFVVHRRVPPLRRVRRAPRCREVLI